MDSTNIKDDLEYKDKYTFKLCLWLLVEKIRIVSRATDTDRTASGRTRDPTALLHKIDAVPVPEMITA